MAKRCDRYKIICTSFGLAEAGRTLVIERKKGEIVEPHDVLTVMREGMPVRGNRFEKGNLFLKFEVEFPPDNFASPDKMKVRWRLAA